MLVKELNSPQTSSVGRLFDGVSALLGLCSEVSYEGEAAMKLQFISDAKVSGGYQMPIVEGQNGRPIIIDWRAAVQAICCDIQAGSTASSIAAKFHNALCDTVVEVAEIVGLPDVLLCGGCFQNKFLLEQSIYELENAGYQAHWQRRLPPNDGCIALGQLIAAIRDDQAWQNRVKQN